MKWNTCKASFFLCLHSIFFLAFVPSLLAAERRPNIVLIVVDDLGYGELGCYGGELATPHIDALAASGVRFTQGYVTAPFCAASRAALLTGRYQTRFGFEFNPIGAQNAKPGIGLPVAEKTLADHLRDVGYATGLIGKWHLGGTAEFHPQRRGFDEFFGFLHEGHYYVPSPWNGVTTLLRRKSLPDGGSGRWVSADGRVLWSTHMASNEPPYDADNPLLRGSQPVHENDHLTDAFTREACQFIERHAAQPFFLCLTYNAVHSPMQAADRYMTQMSHIGDAHRRIFASMLAHLDDAVGSVRNKIHDLRLDEETLIAFISDNGGPTKELTSSNRPLGGAKGELREGGIRVPFLMSWKDHIPAGVVEQMPVASFDLTATALEVAEAKPKGGKLDGISLYSKGKSQLEAKQDRTFYWRVGAKHALRSGKWKMVRNDKEWQLYDLEQDLGETIDLAAPFPDRVQQLSVLWEAWNAEQIDAKWK